ncbi:unnamed protein product [Prorocentrum cordatum]|nr:unnamed protein product [Polarella glacialis]
MIGTSSSTADSRSSTLTSVSGTKATTESSTNASSSSTLTSSSKTSTTTEGSRTGTSSTTTESTSSRWTSVSWTSSRKKSSATESSSLTSTSASGTKSSTTGTSSSTKDSSSSTSTSASGTSTTTHSSAIESSSSALTSSRRSSTTTQCISTGSSSSTTEPSRSTSTSAMWTTTTERSSSMWISSSGTSSLSTSSATESSTTSVSMITTGTRTSSSTESSTDSISTADTTSNTLERNISTGTSLVWTSSTDSTSSSTLGSSSSALTSPSGSGSTTESNSSTWISISETISPSESSTTGTSTTEAIGRTTGSITIGSSTIATASSGTAISRTGSAFTVSSTTLSSITIISDLATTRASTATATAITATSTTAATSTASALTSTTLTSTTTALFVVTGSLEFNCAGTQESIESLLISYLSSIATAGALPTEVSVTVAPAAGASGRGLQEAASANVSVAWGAAYEIVADQEAAETIFQTAKQMSVDTPAAAAALATVFEGAGLELEEASVVIGEPEMKIVTATRTSVSTTATHTATLASATSTATSASPARTSSPAGLTEALLPPDAAAADQSTEASTRTVLLAVGGAFGAAAVALGACMTARRCRSWRSSCPQFDDIDFDVDSGCSVKKDPTIAVDVDGAPCTGDEAQGSTRSPSLQSSQKRITSHGDSGSGSSPFSLESILEKGPEYGRESAPADLTCAQSRGLCRSSSPDRSPTFRLQVAEFLVPGEGAAAPDVPVVHGGGRGPRPPERRPELSVEVGAPGARGASGGGRRPHSPRSPLSPASPTFRLEVGAPPESGEVAEERGCPESPARGAFPRVPRRAGVFGARVRPNAQAQHLGVAELEFISDLDTIAAEEMSMLEVQPAPAPWGRVTSFGPIALQPGLIECRPHRVQAPSLGATPAGHIALH